MIPLYLRKLMAGLLVTCILVNSAQADFRSRNSNFGIYPPQSEIFMEQAVMAPLLEFLHSLAGKTAYRLDHTLEESLFSTGGHWRIAQPFYSWVSLEKFGQ